MNRIDILFGGIVGICILFIIALIGCGAYDTYYNKDITTKQITIIFTDKIAYNIMDECMNVYYVGDLKYDTQVKLQYAISKGQPIELIMLKSVLGNTKIIDIKPMQNTLPASCGDVARG
jgi:hypothetical protein